MCDIEEGDYAEILRYREAARARARVGGPRLREGPVETETAALEAAEA